MAGRRVSDLDVACSAFIEQEIDRLAHIIATLQRKKLMYERMRTWDPSSDPTNTSSGRSGVYYPSNYRRR